MGSAWRAIRPKAAPGAPQMMSFTASGSRGSLFIEEMATYGDEFHFGGLGRREVGGARGRSVRSKVKHFPGTFLRVWRGNDVVRVYTEFGDD